MSEDQRKAELGHMAPAERAEAVNALRGPMVGVHTGSLITATRRIGPQYNYYPYFASVSSRF